MADIERELARVAKRFETGTERLEQERREVIRKAAGEGLSLRRIGKIVGLSHQRVDQIIRGSRV